MQQSQPHFRRVMRRAIQALLKSEVDVGERVFATTPDPVYLSDVPAVFIHYGPELINEERKPDKYREQTLFIDALAIWTDSADASESLEDQLDSRAYEIEAALEANQVFGLGDVGNENIIEVIHTNTDPVMDIDEQEVRFGGTRLTYTIRYVFTPGQSCGADEFLNYGADFDIDQDGVVDIETETTIRGA